MSKIVKCPYCSWEGDSRGLKGHIKFKHGKTYEKDVSQEAESPIIPENSQDISIPNEGGNDMVKEAVEKEVKELEKDEEKEGTRYVACPNCGNMIPEDVSYCHECGCELEWEDE